MSKREPLEVRAIHGGAQKVFRFDNGYGASVIQHEFSYGGNQGLWELAVLRFKGKGFDLCYDTPITDDVLGDLSDAEVDELLDRISALPAYEAAA